MSIEFHWEVDHEEGWEPLPPEPPRRIRWRLVGLTLTILLLAGAGAVGYAWSRVRQGQEDLKRDLKSAVSLEARALRQGDRATFLWLQDPNDPAWYTRQEERLPDPGGQPSLEPGQEMDLTVLDAALAPGGESAWAEVAWAQADGTYRRVQFYRLADGRWQRTGAGRAYFGQEYTHTTAHFVFTYLERDARTVEWMADQLEAWYAAICADLACLNQGQPLNVLITTDPANRPVFSPPQGITLTSPRLRGVREDGAPLPEERAALARLLIYTQVARWAGDVQPSRQPYLAFEFANWEMHRLGLAEDGPPSTPVLDFVMESHGLEGVRALLASMGRTNSEGEALHMALSAGPGGRDRFPWSERDGLVLVQSVSFDEYLAALLGLERQLAEWGMDGLVGPTSGPLAHEAFRSLLAGRARTWQTQMLQAFDGWRVSTSVDVLPPGSPKVLRQGSLNDVVKIDSNVESGGEFPKVLRQGSLNDVVLWAEVSYTQEGAAGGCWRIEFFRHIDGAWRHTQPDPRFPGDEVALDTGHSYPMCGAG